MTPTIGFQLRLPAAEYDALDQAAPRGKKNEYLRGLLRRDLIRRGLLPAAEPAGKRKGGHK